MSRTETARVIPNAPDERPEAADVQQSENQLVDEVRASIEALGAENELFANSDAATPRPRFWQMYEAMILALSACYTIPKLHRLALATVGLIREVIKIRRRIEEREETGNERPYVPSIEFFGHLEKVFAENDALNNPVPIPIEETVAELAAQGVSHNQIGRMYLIAPDLVRAELANPGSVVKKNHVTQTMLDRADALKRQTLELRIIPKEADTIQILRLQEDRD